MDEDYAPWALVRELLDGHLTWAARNGDDQRYDVQWWEGVEKQEAWRRYGLLDDVGTYLARARR